MSKLVTRDHCYGPNCHQDPFRALERWAWGEGFPETAMTTSGALVKPIHADLVETDTSYVVKADLPGVKKEDVKISYDHNVLTIAAERKEQTKKDTDRFHMEERRFGSFSRSFRLPQGIDHDATVAKFTEGELEVTVPKAPKPATKTVQIQ